MISAHRTAESTSAASEALVPPAKTVRACTDRQRRLTEYIRGHTGEDVAVRLTPSVPTACVMPTSEETLSESDNADLSSEEAQQLMDSVDANYLVLISTAPATIDRLPITDQLTADRAQQFGYALHELGHIRYTAIAASASKIEDRVEEEHRDFVKGLWNSCEDAAIENQLAADQSQLAADRLEIVSRSISTPADEFAPDQQAEFSFRDGIETALYDRGIYETGVCERLCDADDNQFVFATNADRQAFAEINESIDNLLAAILTTPSSTERAEALLEWWESEIKPLLSPPDQDENSNKQPDDARAQSEGDTSNGQEQNDTEQRGDPSTEQQREGGGTSQTTTRGEESSPESRSAPAGEPQSENGGEVNESSETRPNPSDINTDQHQETPGTDALEYPDMGDEADAEALRKPSEDAATESETPEDAAASQETDSSGGNEGDEANSESESETEIETDSNPESSEENEDQESQKVQEDEESSPEDATDSTESPGDGNESANESTDEDDENSTGGSTSNDSDDQGRGSETENSDGPDSDRTSAASMEASPWMGSDSSNQTSLGSFAQVEDNSEGSDDGSTSEDDGDPAHSDEEAPLENATSDGNASSESDTGREDRDGVAESSSENGEGGDEADIDTSEAQNDNENASAEDVGDGGEEKSGQSDHSDPETTTTDASDQGEGAPLDPAPAHEGSDLEQSDALDTDRDGARDEAEQSTPDEAQLERDLEDVASALDELEDEDGGTGAAPESLDELSVMPDTIDTATDQSTVRRWEDADADAGYVADALRKALKESRQTGSRSGLTSGSFDRRRAGALARGEVTAFQVRQPGEEKQYDLVLILDRSGSMRTQISTAEDALVRFAVACEDVGINVGIIDFYDDEARLIKPFSIEAQYVQPSLFSGKYVGGTPLADALGISHELLEQRRNNPLVIVVTDGKPGDADAYQDELARSYAPICGLTLSLGTARGNVPDKVAKNEQFYDRHIYVHDSDQITNRLDQFAVMFDGL